jgi:sphinganine-1-phosphate aldolase
LIIFNIKGGVYASPTMAGSRPGSLIAGCWAAMLKMGISGYTHSTKMIIDAAYKIKSEIAAIPHLNVIGNPLLSVVSFDATLPIKTYAVADLVSRNGWHLNILQFPPSIHIACTLLTTVAVDELINDVRNAVQVLIKDPTAGNGELSAIYGTAASVPDRSIIEDVSKGFLDGLTKI